MSNLWNPTQQESAAIARGDRKIAIGKRRRSGDVLEANCTTCKKDVLINRDGKMYLYNGSVHQHVVNKSCQ